MFTMEEAKSFFLFIFFKFNVTQKREENFQNIFCLFLDKVEVMVFNKITKCSV